jgi:ABC-type multidrug transport system ATPase subunit/ABC-type multidrug transport system permease subunit
MMKEQAADIEGGGSGSHGRVDRSVSTLERSTDPFAEREGKALVWRHVNMTLAAKGDQPKKKLLDEVWGEVPPRETTAIMGPSGAGKTSLLNILAGRASSRGPLTIEADVRLNNYTVDPTNMNVRKLIAFVAQDDSLQVTSTPREAIRFSAKLRLPRSTKESQIEKLVERMITELGLSHCADTIVGGALIKGISGGERKRTSVGVELVTKPALVFLDEPTSGLDSFSAVQLCQVLKKVANAGASVLFTIHQPSSEIFNSFDHLILMNRGRVMYQGSVSGVPDFFAERGKPNPTNYNPADWIMDVAQSNTIEELDKANFFPKDTREMGEPFEPGDGKDALGITITRYSLKRDETGVVMGNKPPGFLTQTQLLFQREILNLRRDTHAVAARYGISIFMGILIGVIFLNVGKSDPTVPSNLQSHFGALVMVTLTSMFGTAQPALLAFPSERPVFLREYSTNHYGVASYFISKLTMEATLTALQVLLQSLILYYMIGFQAMYGLFFACIYALGMTSTALAVFLGSSVEDPKMAQEFLPLLFVPQMLFAGFFVAPRLIPIWLRWAQYLCSLTYAVRLIMIYEFYDCGSGYQDSVEGIRATISCNQLLKNVDAVPGDAWWYWIVLAGLFVVFRSMALFVLRKKATKFF